MKRPIGLTLSAIALGLLAAFTLLVAAMFGFAAFAVQHTPMTQPGVAARPQPPAFVAIIIVAMAIFAAGIAVWEVCTVVGLFKLKNWARYSILVIGALLALFGLISSLGAFVVAAMGGQLLPPNPQMPAHTMQVLMTVTGLFYLCFAALGSWWLVYYNLKSVKHYFLPAYAQPYTLDPAFPALPPPPPGRFAHVPTSIIVFACIYLFSAVICVLSTFIPIPVFFLGTILHGWGSHLLYLGLAVACGLIGGGLLRLDNRARLGSYALIAFGLVNFVMLVTPLGQSRYAEYNRELYARMYSQGMALTPAPPPFIGHFMVFGLVFSMLFYGVQIWLIERQRAAFLTRA